MIKRMNMENDKQFFRRLAIVSFSLATSLVVFYGIYYFLMSPVMLPHDEVGVVKCLYKKNSFVVSKQNLSGYYSKVPYVSFELVSNKECVCCQVDRGVYNYLSEGDTCVLRYMNGEYVYAEKVRR